MKDDPDSIAIDFARKHLDLTKNLRDQGYYGPFPNDADPRTSRRADDKRPETTEYYDWVEQWIVAHGGKFDNETMTRDRRAYLRATTPGPYCEIS